MDNKKKMKAILWIFLIAFFNAHATELKDLSIAKSNNILIAKTAHARKSSNKFGYINNQQAFIQHSVTKSQTVTSNTNDQQVKNTSTSKPQTLTNIKDEQNKQPHPYYDFSKPNHYNFYFAKRVLREFYFKESQGKYKKYNKTIYCGCPIIYDNKKMVGSDFNACGFKPYKNVNRAKRIEWEHIVPAYNLGNQRKCWQNGGRKNCTKTDAIFSIMEGDLHNLHPSIGEVNEARSHYRYNDLNMKPNQFGQCPVYVDHKLRIMQPPKEIRGLIARTYFYMYDQYKLKMSKQEAKLFSIWDQQYPPNEWECYRNQKIKELQGNDNPYITAKCKK